LTYESKAENTSLLFSICYRFSNGIKVSSIDSLDESTLKNYVASSDLTGIKGG
jgi:hypothetical protein